MLSIWTTSPNRGANPDLPVVVNVTWRRISQSAHTSLPPHSGNLTESTMKTTRRPIPRQSKRRSVEAKIYAQRKKVFLDTNDHCFCCGLFVYRPIRDLHHVRGRMGKLYLDERFWEMSCRHCHDAIHSNRKWAIANGFLGGAGEWGVCPP